LAILADTSPSPTGRAARRWGIARSRRRLRVLVFQLARPALRWPSENARSSLRFMGLEARSGTPSRLAHRLRWCPDVTDGR
jgi:hypothetical protein